MKCPTWSAAARRRQPASAPLLLGGAILLAVVAHQVAGKLIFAPRFASADAGEVVAAYFTARQWGYRRRSEDTWRRE